MVDELSISSIWGACQAALNSNIYIHQQKQRSLRTSHLGPMRPLRPCRPGVLCVSCLASGASRRPFQVLLLHAPYALVVAHSVPPPLATIPFRLRRPAYPTKLFALGAALATPPLPAAWIHLLASQKASFVICPQPPFYRHAYCSIENSLVVTICWG